MKRWRNMNMNVYNIIWADDEIDAILSDIVRERLKSKGFKIVGEAHDGEELETLLAQNVGVVDAVIVDANFNESSVFADNERDTSGLDYARSLYVHRCGHKIPFFLFTNRSDELLQEIYCSNPKFLEDFPRHKRWFNKSGQGEKDEMFEEIKKAVEEQNTPEFLIRNKYFYELNAASIIDGVQEFFFEVLLMDYKGTLADMREPFISVRRCIEKGFALADKAAIIPPISEDINGTAAYLFHECYKNKEGVILYRMQEQIMPKPVASSLRYVVSIVQDGSHSKKGLSLKVDEYFDHTRDLNLLRSVIFAAMDFLKWLASTLLKYIDMDMNMITFWEKVEGTDAVDTLPESEKATKLGNETAPVENGNIEGQ